MAELKPDSQVADQVIRFHPKAIRPRFQWRMNLPLRWAFLDTHPEVWNHRVDRIIDEFYVGQHLRSADRRALRAQLEKTVKAAQDNGVALVFLQPGVDDEGQVVGCSILARWQNSSPRLASLAAVDASLGASKELEHRTSPQKAAYVLFSEKKSVGPWAERRDMWSTQAFLPVPTTSWTLVLSGSAPSAETGEVIRNMVIHMAESLRAYPEETGRLLGDEEPGDIIVGDDAVRIHQSAVTADEDATRREEGEEL